MNIYSYEIIRDEYKPVRWESWKSVQTVAQHPPVSLIAQFNMCHQTRPYFSNITASQAQVLQATSCKGGPIYFHILSGFSKVWRETLLTSRLK